MLSRANYFISIVTLLVEKDVGEIAENVSKPFCVNIKQEL